MQPLKLPEVQTVPEPEPPPAPPPEPAPAVQRATLPAIADPAGRSVVIDDRTLTEAQFFKYGYDGWSDREITEELEVTVMWLVVVFKREPWLEKMYQMGIEARGRAEARRAEVALYEMTTTRTVRKQQLNKVTGEVETLESEVLPSLPAVERVLEQREPERWGKTVAAAPGTVNNTYIQHATVMLDERRAKLAASEQEASGGQ